MSYALDHQDAAYCTVEFVTLVPQTAFSTVVLFRGDVGQYDPLITVGVNWDDGATKGWGTGIVNWDVSSSRNHTGGYSNVTTTKAVGSGNWGATTWYWVITAYGYDGDNQMYFGTFGSSVVSADWWTTPAGTPAVESILTMRIGADRGGYKADGALAFAGVVPVRLTSATVPDVINNMAGVDWLVAHSVDSSGNAVDLSRYRRTITKVGTFGSLVTDAPNYWTSLSASLAA